MFYQIVAIGKKPGKNHMRVLLIEDDPNTARAIELALTKAHCHVYHTAYGREGLDIVQNYEYDIVLLDLNLPDIAGLEVLANARRCGVTTPVMIVSGLDDIGCKLRGFRLGADDYLTKPFDKRELLARLHAIVRRTRGHAQAKIRVGSLVVYLDGKTVTDDDRPLPLTPKEYCMLELLVLRRGNTITKAMFLDHLYGGIDEPSQKIVDVFMSKLRQKLRTATEPPEIETVWGRGYRLKVPPEAPPCATPVRVAAGGTH